MAQLDGEEFAVLLPNATAADAQAQCERLREAIAATPMMLVSAAHRVTISVGVTTYVPPESTDDALSRADMRVYGAKTAGRNRVIADAVAQAVSQVNASRYFAAVCATTSGGSVGAGAFLSQCWPLTRTVSNQSRKNCLSKLGGFLPAVNAAS